jgi:transcriptional regulator with XRE-family HTH domain
MSHARRTQRPYPDLAAWRAAQGLNQLEAARLLGVSQTTYSRLERGIRTAVRENAKRIMAATGVPLEVLVGVN